MQTTGCVNVETTGCVIVEKTAYEVRQKCHGTRTLLHYAGNFRGINNFIICCAVLFCILT